MEPSQDLSVYTAMELKGTVVTYIDQSFRGIAPPPKATKSSGDPVYFIAYSNSSHPYFKKKYMILNFAIRVSSYTVASGHLSRDYLLSEGEDPRASAPGIRLGRGQSVRLRRPLTINGCDIVFPPGYQCVILSAESTAAPKMTTMMSEREQERQLRCQITMALTKDLIYKVILEVQDPDEKYVWYETRVEVAPTVEEMVTGAP